MALNNSLPGSIAASVRHAAQATRIGYIREMVLVCTGLAAVVLVAQWFLRLSLLTIAAAPAPLVPSCEAAIQMFGISGDGATCLILRDQQHFERLRLCDGKVVAEFFVESLNNRCTAFSADTSSVVALQRSSDMLWFVDDETQAIVTNLGSVLGHFPTAVALSPNGNLAVVGAANGVAIAIAKPASGTIMDLEQASLSGRNLMAIPDDMTRMAISHDGTRLLVATEVGDVYVLDIATGTTVVRQCQNGVVSVLEWSPSGRYYAAGTDQAGGGVRIWDAQTHALTSVATTGEFATFAISFTDNDDEIVAAGTDGRIRSFHTASGQLRATVQGHLSAVRSLAFAPRQRSFFSAGIDGAIHQWSLSSLVPREVQLSMVR